MHDNTVSQWIADECFVSAQTCMHLEPLKTTVIHVHYHSEITLVAIAS